MDRARAEDARDGLGIEHRLGGDVERPAHVGDEGAPVRVPGVERMHRLHPQAGDVGHDPQDARPQQGARQQRACEEPPDA